METELNIWLFSCTKKRKNLKLYKACECYCIFPLRLHKSHLVLHPVESGSDRVVAFVFGSVFRGNSQVNNKTEGLGLWFVP